MRLPNGFGGISKLSGNRRRPYAVRITLGWTDEAKQIVKYLGYYATRAEALKALSAYNLNPYDLQKADLSVAQIYSLWVNWLRTDKNITVDKRYTSAYSNSVALHDMRFRDVRKRHIQAAIDGCRLGSGSKRNIKTLYNQLFKFAIDRELVQTNYAALCETPSGEDSTLHKPFTDEEIAELWKHKDEEPAQYALVYIYTGLRPSELVQIKTESVYIDKYYMIGGMKTRAGKNRIVPIANKIMPIIQEWYDPGNEYLCNVNGNPIRNLQRLTRLVWKKHSLLSNHLPHDGRHTCATLLDNAEVSRRIIQLILGHTTSDITERVYTHKTIDQLIEAINKI